MSNTLTKAIHWFRQDLRLADNPALREAAKADDVLCVYILDDESAGEFAMGGASRWWLHHSLKALDASLNGKLAIFKGKADEILPKLAKDFEADAVYWNRCYEPWRTERDENIKSAMKAEGIHAESFNGSLLWEPWDVKKQGGTPYRVFTPYYRKGCLNAKAPREPLAIPPLNLATTIHEGIDALSLLPTINWDTQLEPHWVIGEEGATTRLKAFLEKGIENYKKGRDYPALRSVSRLSPHLHFGEISPNTIWHAARATGDNQQVDHFCSELGWREFSHSLLYYNPELARAPLQEKFLKFPWNDDDEALKRWQQGRTGYPIVDAGMRELWQTGYMHNRVRMIVGSFLVKNLLQHWHYGERWFWDCLVDADMANNSASWQWIAGCGADAAPYFRIFNPITQGQRFDPKGEYTRHFVPELKDLPDKYLFSPWEAPQEALAGAGVTLGENYPKPMVDVKTSRQRALDAFGSLR